MVEICLASHTIDAAAAAAAAAATTTTTTTFHYHIMVNKDDYKNELCGNCGATFTVIAMVGSDGDDSSSSSSSTLCLKKRH